MQHPPSEIPSQSTDWLQGPFLNLLLQLYGYSEQLELFSYLEVALDFYEIVGTFPFRWRCLAIIQGWLLK